jgi:isocitrate dehydrogenase
MSHTSREKSKLIARVRRIKGQLEGIERALEATITRKTVTYDLARLMEGATELSCSAFATAIIDNMER